MISWLAYFSKFNGIVAEKPEPYKILSEKAIAGSHLPFAGKKMPSTDFLFHGEEEWNTFVL